jgi:hypothetical protein
MRREYRYGISAACGLVLLLAGVLPETLWTRLPAVCLFRNLFGFECFGCGMTRALASALHGEISRALQLNAGVALAAPALVAGVLQVLRIRP